LIPTEALDLIAVGGLGYRMWGKDIDVRVMAPFHKELITFPFGTNDQTIIETAQSLIDLSAVCAIVREIADTEVPIDGGLTVYSGDGFNRTVFFDDQFRFFEVADFLWFKWCYYIQRGEE
jgi:hypothetical protein